jgi:hypothetical protein
MSRQSKQSHKIKLRKEITAEHKLGQKRPNTRTAPKDRPRRKESERVTMGKVWERIAARFGDLAKGMVLR